MFTNAALKQQLHRTLASLCFSTACRPRVDALHSKNHTTCNPELWITTYKDPLTATINSAGPEQINAGLSALETVLAYSTGVHATMLLERFVMFWNKNKRAASAGIGRYR